MIFHSQLPHRSLPGRPITEGSDHRTAGVANEHFSSSAELSATR